MKNRVFSFVLALSVLFNFGVFSANAQASIVCGDWNDVDQNVEGFDEMVEVCELNWIRGGGGRLNLNNKLKRIELVAIVNRVLGLDTSVEGEIAYQSLIDQFNDIGDYDPAKDWMYRGMYLGVEQQANFNQRFWNGYEDGTFRKMNDISFAEFSKLILFSFEKMDELNGNFRLSEFNGLEWYSNYFNFLENKGVLSYEDGMFEFDGKKRSVHEVMTRHDAIKFISKMLDRDIYLSGKVYEFDGARLEIPFYMAESETVSQNVRVWRDETNDGALVSVKLLKDKDLNMPYEFSSVYVPLRLQDQVERMFRIDRCNESDSCLRAFWLVMKNGEILVIEGSFDKEKTASAEKAVSSIVDSIELN